MDFSFVRMSRFLIYHLLWFSLGLLSLAILIPLEGVAMCRNMAFFPVHNRFFYEVLMQQMTFFLMVMMYFMNNPPNIYIEEVYFAILALFIRSFIIACRYGFISEERLRTVRKGKQKLVYLKSDLILFNIVSIRPQALEDEIPASIWRNEIEEEDFEFRFLERPGADLQEKLLDRNYYVNNKYSKSGTVSTSIKRLSEVSEKIRKNVAIDLRRAYTGKQNDGELKWEDAQQQYKGTLLMREIALFSNILPTNLVPYSLIIALRLLIPYFVRWLDNLPVFGEFWFEYVLQFKLIMLSYLMALVNTRFILFGVLDFKRKYFYARLLRSML